MEGVSKPIWENVLLTLNIKWKLHLWNVLHKGYFYFFKICAFNRYKLMLTITESYNSIITNFIIILMLFKLCYKQHRYKLIIILMDLIYEIYLCTKCDNLSTNWNKWNPNCWFFKSLIKYTWSCKCYSRVMVTNCHLWHL